MEIPANLLLTQDLVEAKKLQLIGQKKVITEDQLQQVNYVAGVDVGFQNNYQITQGAITILKFPELNLVESAIAQIPTTLPYIPGFLSFREIPAILAALKKIKITPDLIFCDGQGYAHPRRFGLACHLGVILDLPTIGVAKNLLIGKHQELDLNKGSWQPLIDQEEIIGAVVRSRTKVKPIYVSIGHKISLATAIEYVFQCLTKYRLPETTRYADKLASSKTPT